MDAATGSDPPAPGGPTTDASAWRRPAQDASARDRRTAERSPPAEPVPHRRLADSLRWRLALSYAGLLIVAGAVLLFFVNAAARLVNLPVVDVNGTINGQTFTQQYVDASTAAARAATLDRLRFYSIIAFAVLAALGLCIGWMVSGRALKPIGQMAAVARRISERNLEERINLPGPEDELKQLADSFDAMVERLDDAFMRQRQFVADASHELRTPLTALQLSIDSVRHDPGATVDDFRQVAAEATAATARMRRLVDDLLALADESAPPPPVEVSLASLCASVVEEIEPVARQREVTVASRVEGGPVAYGDADLLRRALRNLVENAVRYNRPGGHVVVEQAPAVEGFAAVSVTDDGIGIAEEDLARVFDRFHRVDRSRSRGEGGSGLGLAIVAKIAAMQGGGVAVDSAPGKGSRFTLTLPAPSPAADGAPSEGGAEARRGSRELPRTAPGG